ncbi:MAG: acetolactate synthase [Blautia sp.]|nr:acetolactate synthase [Blautia sp.]
MSIKQISVFLENKPGTLNRMTAALSEGRVDMRALSVAETKDFGIARMIVDDVFNAMNVLKEADFVASLTPVLAYEIPDETGGLNKLLGYFTDAQVNIEYMYAFLGGKDAKHAYMIFRVADTKAAEAALAGKGLKAVSQEEIALI